VREILVVLAEAKRAVLAETKATPEVHGKKEAVN
jgi:hypothetical protein